MLKFEPMELEKEIRDTLLYIKDKIGAIEKLVYEDEFFCNLEDFILEKVNKDDYENVITEKTEICIAPDDCEDFCESINIRTFFNLVTDFKNIIYFDMSKCIMKNKAVYKVDSYDEDTQMILDFSFGSENIGLLNSEYRVESTFSGKKVICSLVQGLTSFGLKILEVGLYNDIQPPIEYNEVFIQIEASDLSNEDFDEIASAYIFELSACECLELYITERVEYKEWGYYSERSEQAFENMRLLTFGKGIGEVHKLFNSAISASDIDMRIIQFTKILEYISQTVVRLDKTEKIQCKLNSLRAVHADANYIKELEMTFDNLKNKYLKDSDAIRETIARCCDVEDVADIAPEFIKKCKTLKQELLNEKCDRDKLIEAVVKEIADSVSDTRNEIAHAKANYVKKGHECPEEMKAEFVELLKKLSIQAIRWYSNLSDNQRVTL